MSTSDASQICTAALNHTITPSAAATSLTAPAASVLADPQAVEDALWEIWNALLASATRTAPDQQGPLVDLLDAVKQLRGASGEAVEFEFWGAKTTWKELPSLGMVFREQYGLESDDGGSGFVNLNAFAARLTAAGVLDLSLYGIWTLRSVLEDQEPGQAAVEERSRGLESVAVWFMYSGRSMLELSREEKVFEGAVAVPGKSITDKQWKGYSKERWELWVARFRKFHELAIAGEENGMVKKAAVEIDKISQGE
ncbi:hypothetical protein SLS56_004612 [Neofusicoccum ribis]|uniref:Uncharacterized protein n=1 Tax=Neofusicoccum ribis TaxID=45134 RepID=A0ABR3SW09_9PEZI